MYQRATESPAEVREPLQQQLVTVSAGPLGIGLKDKQAGGPVVVSSVDPGSSLAAQGVRVGGVVLAINRAPTGQKDKKGVVEMIRAATRPLEISLGYDAAVAPRSPSPSVPPSAAQGEVSPGGMVEEWEMHRTPSGRNYFYNAQSRTSQWEPPSPGSAGDGVVEVEVPLDLAQPPMYADRASDASSDDAHSPPSRTQSMALPDGWQRIDEDQPSGRLSYFYNEALNVSQWEDPQVELSEVGLQVGLSDEDGSPAAAPALDLRRGSMLTTRI